MFDQIVVSHFKLTEEFLHLFLVNFDSSNKENFSIINNFLYDCCRPELIKLIYEILKKAYEQ